MEPRLVQLLVVPRERPFLQPWLWEVFPGGVVFTTVGAFGREAGCCAQGDFPEPFPGDESQWALMTPTPLPDVFAVQCLLVGHGAPVPTWLVRKALVQQRQWDELDVLASSVLEFPWWALPEWECHCRRQKAPCFYVRLGANDHGVIRRSFNFWAWHNAGEVTGLGAPFEAVWSDLILPYRRGDELVPRVTDLVRLVRGVDGFLHRRSGAPSIATLRRQLVGLWSSPKR